MLWSNGFNQRETKRERQTEKRREKEKERNRKRGNKVSDDLFKVRVSEIRNETRRFCKEEVCSLRLELLSHLQSVAFCCDAKEIIIIISLLYFPEAIHRGNDDDGGGGDGWDEEVVGCFRIHRLSPYDRFL